MRLGRSCDADQLIEALVAVRGAPVYLRGASDLSGAR